MIWRQSRIFKAYLCQDSRCYDESHMLKPLNFIPRKPSQWLVIDSMTKHLALRPRGHVMPRKLKKSKRWRGSSPDMTAFPNAESMKHTTKSFEQKVALYKTSTNTVRGWTECPIGTRSEGETQNRKMDQRATIELLAL